MTKSQQKLIQLLKELKLMCDENNLSFFLIGSYALRGFRSGTFESELPILEIGMLYKDIIKLKRIIDKLNNINICIESLYSNTELKANIFRYVDKNTLHWRLNNPLKFKEMGIAVTIIPIYSYNVEKHFSFTKYVYYYWVKMMSKKSDLLKKLPKKVLKKYESFIRVLMLAALNKLERKAEINDSLYYRKNLNLKKVKLPRRVYSQTQTVEFEGVECKIPKNCESYFNVVLGSAWKSKVYNQEELNKNVIIDAEYSYAEYKKALRENNVSGDITRYISRMKKMNKPLKECNDFIKKQWDIVKDAFEEISD